ncbi:hypothetical protein COT86_00710 [Candidatus Collierbacteria bacterium CG10_big_fil_rev_8_21_14_0_10_43_36]|uniref:Nudix hydrolase domain-containing protein n=3 Tax=Candidatus Collieribacteriota TaxID=1752725 RepID=A0A2H0VLU3_9BACT|nr:MAG: hypothetical protein COT86_00710 [Candidatus Collierbacteria bacterium CG10_big_fil_rev_8_21_14_0_10_43_36]
MLIFGLTINKKQMRQFIQLMIFDEEKNHLLAVKRAESDTSFGGMWGLPGGGVIDGETIDFAAARELKEETNLEIKHISSEPFFELTPTLKGTQIHLIVKSASVQPGELNPNDKDIETISWITPEKLISSFIAFGIPTEAITKFQSKLKLLK